jgi:hypothetical protein
MSPHPYGAPVTAGGTVTSTAPFMVGEQGPEMVWFDAAGNLVLERPDDPGDGVPALIRT